MHNSETLKKVSCIIPVYNGAEYLPNAIKYLQNQTLKEAEFVFVNDQSEDDTLALLEKYSQSDSRIRIVSNPCRMGAAYSRNRGLDAAEGDYVIFLDVDDLYYPNLLMKSYQAAIENKADIVIFGNEQENLQISPPEIKVYSDPWEVCVYGARTGNYVRKIQSEVWNKLIKRSFLCSNSDIRYQDIPTDNDVFFSYSAALLAPVTVIMDDILIHYYAGLANSITQSRTKTCRYAPLAWEHLLILLEKRQIEKEVMEELYRHIVNDLLYFFTNDGISLECKRNSEKVLRSSKILLEKMILAQKQGVLAGPHMEFVKNITEGKSVSDKDMGVYYLRTVSEIIEAAKRDRKKVAIWGCGMLGKQIISAMDSQKIYVDYLIDSNEKLQHSFYLGYEIQGYSDVSDDVDIIMVSSHKFFDSIHKLIEGKVVLDLLEPIL